jgi:hypothetical protein
LRPGLYIWIWFNLVLDGDESMYDYNIWGVYGKFCINFFLIECDLIVLIDIYCGFMEDFGLCHGFSQIHPTRLHLPHVSFFSICNLFYTFASIFNMVAFFIRYYYMLLVNLRACLVVMNIHSTYLTWSLGRPWGTRTTTS